MYERIDAAGPFVHKQWWSFLRTLHEHYGGMTLSSTRLATVLQDVASGKTVLTKRQQNLCERRKLWVQGDGGRKSFVTLSVTYDDHGQESYGHPTVALRPDSVMRELAEKKKTPA